MNDRDRDNSLRVLREKDETLSKRSAQIGDLKNKLIKAQQEVIELRQKLNDKYKCNKCGDVFSLDEVAHLIRGKIIEL